MKSYDYDKVYIDIQKLLVHNKYIIHRIDYKNM